MSRLSVYRPVIYALLIVLSFSDNRLSTMIEALRQQNDGGLLPGSTAGPTSMMQSGINQAKEVDDPQGLHEKVEFLLREWVNMYHSPQAGRDSTKAFQTFVAQVISLVTQ